MFAGVGRSMLKQASKLHSPWSFLHMSEAESHTVFWVARMRNADFFREWWKGCLARFEAHSNVCSLLMSSEREVDEVELRLRDSKTGQTSLATVGWKAAS